MVKDRAVEENCIFHEHGNCRFNESYETRCSLCFNFCSTVKFSESLPVRSIYTIFDYLKANGNNGLKFSSDNSTQGTLF
jgi:hypothetical protein